MTVYILSVDGDVWGAYSSMEKAESVIVDHSFEDGSWYIATREVE